MAHPAPVVARRARPVRPHAIPDILDKYEYIHIPSWLTMGSIDDARAILSATMGAVATVLALIFSVSLLVLSMVSTLFGPRLLYRFLITHEDPTSRFVPQISLITCWFLVVGSFAFLVYYSHRIASSIQNPDLVGRIADDVYPAAASARERGAAEGTGERPDDAAIAHEASLGARVPCAKSGYFQHVDHDALVAAAQREDVKIVLQFRPGQFLLRGELLASVCPKERGAALEREIDRAVRIGRHRTLTQDSEFAIAQIVEIAIRALSPAVNDTFTGVACVDWLADALLVLAEKPPLEGNFYDARGKLRVWMPEVRLERLVKLAFDQIRQASASTPAVLIRQLDVIGRLAPRVPPARRALADQAAAIVDTASALVPHDRRDLDAALARARQALDTAGADRVSVEA